MHSLRGLLLKSTIILKSPSDLVAWDEELANLAMLEMSIASNVAVM